MVEIIFESIIFREAPQVAVLHVLEVLHFSSSDRNHSINLITIRYRLVIIIHCGFIEE